MPDLIHLICGSTGAGKTTYARQVSEQVGGGVPCVLDVGFAEAASRMRFIRLAQEAALPVHLHFLDVPSEERWRRVQARNGDSANSDRLPFEITREMFDFVETLWEPPTEQELSGTLPMTVRR